MAKKIILCLDGTGDFAAANPTHVFRLFCELEKDEPSQKVFYDGGIGTLEVSDDKLLKRRFQQLMDLAFGLSLRRNFVKAYTFIVENYTEGDEIYIFGFSRGAFTARVVAGVIEMFGIVRPESKSQVDYIWQYYKKAQKNSFEIGGRFKRKFCTYGQTGVPITYMGLWDTVSSIGLFHQSTFPFTSRLGSVARVRHAVAIDEHRNMFAQNTIQPKHSSLYDHQEVWFAGVHRDVGGGGVPASTYLDQIPYQWVIDPLVRMGVIFDQDREILDVDATSPIWNQNYFMTALYGLIGLIPQNRWEWNKGREVIDGKAGHRKWKLFRFINIRRPGQNSKIHCSVARRVKDANLGYLPKSVFKNTNLEFADSTYEFVCDCNDLQCPARKLSQPALQVTVVSVDTGANGDRGITAVVKLRENEQGRTIRGSHTEFDPDKV